MKPALAILLLLAGGCAAQAQVPPPAAKQGEIRGAFFALSVRDAPLMAEWYRTHLGFRTLSEGKVPERQIAFALLERNGSPIEIVQRPDTKAAPTGPTGARAAIGAYGVFKIGFNVSDLQALHDRLAAAGVTFDHHIVQPNGNPWRTFAVRDPEGNIVQIFG